MLFVNLIIYGLVAVVCVTKSTEGQQKCRTPSGSIGHCVGFESCLPLYKIIQAQWVIPQDFNLIDKSWCGSYNGVQMICCPKASSTEVTTLQPVSSAIPRTRSAEGQQKCRTPSGSIGYCVRYESCLPLYKIIQAEWVTPHDFNLIEQSWCGSYNGVQMICCPKVSSNEVTRMQPVSSAIPRSIITDLSTHPNAKLLPFQNCGQNSGDKITNGEKTEPFQFPWMAMLRTILSGNTVSLYCSGALISNRYVLTAAHCLRTVQGEIKIHSVVLGEYDTTSDPDCIDDDECADPIQEIPVERSIPHPNFILSNAQNDIGLVRLRRNVQFSDSVMPICIPYTQESQNFDYKKIIVSGWGGTEYGLSSNVLLKAILDVIPNSECSKIYGRIYYDRLQISEMFICAYGGLRDTCGGDSGGPASHLASISRFGPRMFQYGVVSAGARTCGLNNGVPGLYTPVTNYVQWILDNIY